MDAPAEGVGHLQVAPNRVQGNIVVKPDLKNKDWWLADLHVHVTANSGLPEVVKREVANLPIPELYFYGSRSKTYIPVEDQESDWDFAFQNSQKSAEAIVDAGFVLRTDVYPYTDSNSFECYEKIVDGHKIQLVSKGNLELFKDVWYLTSDSFWEDYMNKRSNKYIGKDGVTDLMKHFHRMVQTGVHRPLGDML